jgi:transposase
MDVLIERCAGVDIGKRTVAVTVRTPDGKGGRRQETRTFGTVTRQVLELRDWLVAERVSVAAMEAASDDWKPVFYLLEDVTDCWPLNAHHVKGLPGRKTDVKDSEWIAQLVECRLVAASFVPPAPIRELRDLTRYRKTIIEERTREIQRLEKLLEDAGIKLSSVAFGTLGACGRAMIEALIAGERDAAVPNRGLLPGAPVPTRTGLTPAGLRQLAGRNTKAVCSLRGRATHQMEGQRLASLSRGSARNVDGPVLTM